MSVFNITSLSRGVTVELPEDPTPEALVKAVNRAIETITNDITRLAAHVQQPKSVPVTSGSSRLVVPYSGQATVYAICDTATSGSDGSNYYTLTLYRNGIAANTITAATSNKEYPQYQSGVALGAVSVGRGDVLSLNLATTGSPSTSIALSNFSILCLLTGI